MRGPWLGVNLFGLRPAWDGSAWLLLCLLALSAYVLGLGGIGLLGIAATEHNAARPNATTMMLAVPADTSAARLETIVALLKQTPGVASVRIADAAETARLLEPWLGPGGRLDELPVPKLVDIGTDRGKPVDVAALREKLASVAPNASLDDNAAALQQVRSAGWRVAVALGGMIAAGLLGIAAASALRQRIASDAELTTIDIAHRLGATDWDIAHPIARRGLWLGLAGGALGAAATAGTDALLGAFGKVSAAPLTIAGLADWRTWAIIVGMVLATALIAAACGYACVRRRLSDMP